MTSTRRAFFILGRTTLFAIAGAHAQNSYFDDNLTGWQISSASQVSGTPFADDPAAGSSVAGAMKLDSDTMPAIALQCVPVDASFDYIASMRVNSHRTGQRLYVFWTDASCVAADASTSVASVHPDRWDMVTTVAHPALET